MLGVDGDQVGIHHGEDLGQHLEHGHLGAQRREHGRELHAHHASADDGEPARDLLQFKDLVGVDGELGALERDARDRRTCRDHDVLGLDVGSPGTELEFAL